MFRKYYASNHAVANLAKGGGGGLHIFDQLSRNTSLRFTSLKEWVSRPSWSISQGLGDEDKLWRGGDKDLSFLVTTRMFRNPLSRLPSRIELFSFRTFSISSSVRCKHSDTTVDDKDKDKDKEKSAETETPTEKPEEPYDPKEDPFFTQDNAFGSKENKGLGESERPVFNPEDVTESLKPLLQEEELTAPTTCCYSGCANCVWIPYVEHLSKKFTDPSLGRAAILKELEAIDDENIKAFIMMELRVKKLI